MIARSFSAETSAGGQERLREVCEEAELRIEQHEKLRKKEREISQPLHVMR